MKLEGDVATALTVTVTYPEYPTLVSIPMPEITTGNGVGFCREKRV
jgi:hypothetical protein